MLLGLGIQVALFTRIVELPSQNRSFAVLNVTLNQAPLFDHVTVLESDWDSAAYAFTIGYCHPMHIGNKTVPVVSYLALRAKTNETKYLQEWPISMTSVPRISPELSQCQHTLSRVQLG
tara:strand:+ start:106 stop:462 length:357 start_codon:yes stop_codon:yes gene_type:complete